MFNFTLCGQTAKSKFQRNLAKSQENHESPVAILYRYASLIAAHPNKHIHNASYQNTFIPHLFALNT